MNPQDRDDGLEDAADLTFIISNYRQRLDPATKDDVIAHLCDLLERHSPALARPLPAEGWRPVPIEATEAMNSPGLPLNPNIEGEQP